MSKTLGTQVILIDHVRPATDDERVGRIRFPGRTGKIVESRPGEELRVTHFIEVHELYTYPTGPAVPEYQDTLVECEDCGAKFPESELEYSELEDYCHDKVCPKCKSWWCCTLHWETIEEFKQRTNPRKDQHGQPT